MSTVQPSNIVASGDIGQELDTEALQPVFADVDARASPGRLYLGYDEATILVFRSGSYTITGADSLQQIDNHAEKLIDTLSSLDLEFNKENAQPQIKYMVFIADIGESLNLYELSSTLEMEAVEYEPEQFPGLIYNPSSLDCSMTLFSTGKATITGVKSYDEAEAAVTHIQAQL